MVHMWYLQNEFISISCITVKRLMNFGGDLEVVLVKKRGMKNDSYCLREINEG
jgi:hypothetical protein